MMMMTQLGSLNAWEQTSAKPFWKVFLVRLCHEFVLKNRE